MEEAVRGGGEIGTGIVAVAVAADHGTGAIPGVKDALVRAAGIEGMVMVTGNAALHRGLDLDLDPGLDLGLGLPHQKRTIATVMARLRLVQGDVLGVDLLLGHPGQHLRKIMRQLLLVVKMRPRSMHHPNERWGLTVVSVTSILGERKQADDDRSMLLKCG
jgi:hypothetical protein